MSSNLLKHYMTAPSMEKKVFIIDSNELVKKRTEMLALPEKEQEGGSKEGFVSGLIPADVLEGPEDGGNLIKARDEAKEILDQARGEADNILADARLEAERIRKEAKAQAEAEKLQVFAQARQQGYDEGMNKAEAREKDLEQEYMEQARELEDSYQKQVDILEPLFVNTITGIYEHIFHVELSSYREILVYLITTMLRNQEGSRNFIVHVAKDDYPYVSMQKKQMLSGVVSENTNVDVVEDLTLAKNACMIETENGIFDCGLGTQLSELKRKLMLLAWSGSEEAS